ncbi:unnamed protein product, partial [Polarella glacialis]
MDGIAGKKSRNLYLPPNALLPVQYYMFTVRGKVTMTNGTLVTILENEISADVSTILGPLNVRYYGGTGFSASGKRIIVVDFKPSRDPSDPQDKLAEPAYSYSCQKFGTTQPCFADSAPSNQEGGEVSSFRRLATSIILNAVPCVKVTNPETGLLRTFNYRSQDYNHAGAISYPPLSQYLQYCFSGPTILVIRENVLSPGEYMLVVNITKTVQGLVRTASTSLVLKVIQATGVDAGRAPLITIDVQTPQPIVVSATLRLQGQVTNPANDTTYSYKWIASRFGFNPAYNAEMASLDPTYSVQTYDFVPMIESDFNFSDAGQVRTPGGSRYLTIAPNALGPGMQYKLKLEVTDNLLLSQGVPDPIAFAEVVFGSLGLPPSGGRIIASNLSGIALETNFLLSMVGWGGEDIPLSYRFGYRQNYLDPYAETTYLNSVYIDRSYMTTRLPAGLTGSSNGLQVIGSVSSSVGTTAFTAIELSVTAPTSETYAALLQEAANMDPETALLVATMAAQSEVVSADADSLEKLRVGVMAKTLGSGSGDVSLSADFVSANLNLLIEVAGKGVQTDEVVDTLGLLVNLSVDGGYISADNSMGSQYSIDVASSLLAVVDALLPGQAPALTVSAARRLKGGRGQAGQDRGLWNPPPSQRRLQGSFVDRRSPSQKYSHYKRLIVYEQTVSKTLLAQVYPGEVPTNFSLRGQDIYVGKDYTQASLAQSAIRSQFSLPSLDQPDMPAIFNYRYVQYKKFPYDFMVLPANRSLDAPSDNNDSSLVPYQKYEPTQRLWHAMSLEITDETGNSTGSELVDRSLINGSYAMLPKVAAYDTYENGNVEFPSTCFAVDLGSNVNLAIFDPRGSLFSEDSCITVHLGDFVVFADDLASSLGVFEKLGDDFVIGQFVDEYKSMAMVSSTVFVIVMGFIAAAAAFIVDSKSDDKVIPIDMVKSDVIDLPDPHEKVIGTMTFSFRRNHLIFGLGFRHKRLNRERRVYTLVATLLGTEAITTTLHSVLGMNAEEQYVATGLVAGVLMFPLVQLMQFLWVWRPETRILPSPPSRSAPAAPIPLHEQAQPAQFKIKIPNRPAVGKIRAPLKTAAPRAPSSFALPAMPTLQLSQPGAPGLPKITPQPPPRRPNLPPRPPQEPPPSGHLLTASTSSLRPGVPAIENEGGFGNGVPGSVGPWGLTLPELPPLPQGSLKALADGRPVPLPPKRPGAGPRPPQAPPPMSKMFFAVPKGVHLPVPPVPPLSSAATMRPLGGPALPKLPPMLRRPPEQLSSVRIGGDSARHMAAPPPPPVPPPKAAGMQGFGPLPPATPREDNDPTDFPLLPGQLGSEEVSAETPRVLPPVPPPPGPGWGVAPGTFGVHEDVEAEIIDRTFARDPEHTMMPPSRTNSQLPSPSGMFPLGLRAPPLPPGGQSGQMPAMPDLPGMMQSSFPLPEGMQPPPPSMAFSQSMAPPMPPPTWGPQENALALPPLRLAPGGAIRLLTPPKHAPLELPGTILMKVPQVQRHQQGLAPPPPPPSGPPSMPGQLAKASKPCPPEEGEPVIKVRQLAKMNNEGVISNSRAPPRPPPKMPAWALQPRAPSGPPPSHAIVLSKARDSQTQAIISKAKAPSLE